ncbi:MAG: glucans biosynthesis glucosyltransferase MdoH [Azospirillaceae bacterium]
MLRDAASRSAALRRLAVFGPALATTFFAAQTLDAALGTVAPPAWTAALLVTFVLSFGWLSVSFFAAAAGFAMRAGRLGQPGLAEPPDAGALVDRTAIVMATYEEDPAAVTARLQAIHESVARTGHLAAFDFFLLSDTRDPERAVAEEAAWADLVRRTGGHGRIFYRRRAENTGRKAGNIAEFCRRWGAAYEHMVVLDADSLMSGATLVRLVRLMQANPRAALIQVPPMVVNRGSLFARVHQFASRVYGPVAAAGQAFWQVGTGNYWGHNAIIRIAAFTGSCGLPDLPGRAPLGGPILSHDFVEAALLCRDGWQVWMAQDLGGSWEECPPSLLDFAKRDRRWCQGNMQHGRILPVRGLKGTSRLHLAGGVLSYLTAPLWLLFLGVGIAFALRNTLVPPDYFGGAGSFLTAWPVFHAGIAMTLVGLAATMLVLPRIFGLILAIADGPVRRASGGAARLTLGVTAEIVLSSLLAPALMLFQTAFVAQILTGRAVGWTTQRRDDGKVGWGEALRHHGGHTLFGAAVGALAWWLSPVLLAWLSPLVAGLVLSVPLTVLTARPSWGRAARRLGLFVTPEETDPPAEIARANALTAMLRERLAEPADALAHLREDALAEAVHALLLDDGAIGETEPGPALEEARTRLAAGAPLDKADRALLLGDKARAGLPVARPAAAAGASHAA